MLVVRAECMCYRNKGGGYKSTAVEKNRHHLSHQPNQNKHKKMYRLLCETLSLSPPPDTMFQADQ